MADMTILLTKRTTLKRAQKIANIWGEVYKVKLSGERGNFTLKFKVKKKDMRWVWLILLTDGVKKIQ